MKILNSDFLSKFPSPFKWARTTMVKEDDDAQLSFRCNICGAACISKLADLTRENPSCKKCGSSVRMRSIIHLLSLELFNESIPLPEFPDRKDITGIGMSDWDGYSSRLAKKLGYTNTFYHKEPKLDITSVDDIQNGKYDFIISSDVFEHVVPPVSTAFYNTGKLLKKGGVLIFSVPYISMPGRSTIEHFPDLYRYKIINTRQVKILENITMEGVRQTYTNLTFHGGKGNTLEMRSFSESSLWDELQKAGFKDIKKYGQSYTDYGIVWTDEHKTHCSPPITARI